MKTTQRIELVEVGKIIPYTNNARTHSANQIKQLRASLREFGFVNPLLIDQNYNVIAGHGRLMAAEAEGVTPELLLGWLDVYLTGVEIELEGWINLFEHTKTNCPERSFVLK